MSRCGTTHQVFFVRLPITYQVPDGADSTSELTSYKQGQRETGVLVKVLQPGVWASKSLLIPFQAEG
jgi:hypothetical protein